MESPRREGGVQEGEGPRGREGVCGEFGISWVLEEYAPLGVRPVNRGELKGTN